MNGLYFSATHPSVMASKRSIDGRTRYARFGDQVNNTDEKKTYSKGKATAILLFGLAGLTFTGFTLGKITGNNKVGSLGIGFLLVASMLFGHEKVSKLLDFIKPQTPKHHPEDAVIGR